MSSKLQQIPAIRFKGYTNAWEQHRLGGYIQSYIAKTEINNQYPILTSSRRGLFLQTDYYNGNQIASEDNTSYNIVPRGYFTYRHMSDDEVFKFNINELVDFGIVSTLYPVFTTKNGLNSYFLQYILNNGKEFRKYAIMQKQGGSRTYMYLSKLEKLKLTFPSLEEQRKIGAFFRQFDDTIAIHQRQLDNFKQLKKSMVQKIFNQEISFKDSNGKGCSEWKSFKLSDIVYRVTRKNTGLISELPLTISAQYGLVDQLTFFNKSVAGINLEGYYLLRRGEFAYNKSYSAGYPFGAIKRLEKYDMGLLSTLYICFFPKDVVNSDFLAQYFESTKWHKQIVNISGEGARNHGLLNIAIGDFFNTKHYLPCIEEQKKIAEILFSLDKKVETAEKKVTLLKEQKKGLMQIMFL